MRRQFVPKYLEHRRRQKIARAQNLLLADTGRFVYLPRTVNSSPASLAEPNSAADNLSGSFSRNAGWLLLLAAAGIPVSLVWDFAWESTVGVDPVWSLPHTANYLAVALGGLTALGLVFTTSRAGAARDCGVRFGGLHAPLAAWIVVWGAVAFATAVLFDRWWQSAYGLAAGIWHPPQIFKAVAFLALVMGVWLFGLSRQNQAAHGNSPGAALVFVAGGGLMLALITVFTLTAIYPNRQHSAAFYKIACGTYPLVLVALATAGKLRWSATTASMFYMGVLGGTVWVLPLFPARPQVAPIYNPLDHLMPPPFPLLLIFPAMGLDRVLRHFSWPAGRAQPWLQSVAAGLVFFLLFFMTQWVFAEFLLSDSADNWFFSGGGKHWPFFLKISPSARTVFWESRPDEMNLANVLITAGLAMFSARLGLWLGAWMTRVRR